jgi:hypothetical protein
MRFNSVNYYSVFSEKSISVRITPSGAYLTVEIDGKAKDALIVADGADLSFLYDRSEVGYYGAQLHLNDMDRAMLRSAFTHCIE